MDEQTTKAILSGQKAGPGPAMLRTLLIPLGWIYGLAMQVRNRCYDGGWIRSHACRAPVFCIGNLTTGGTGKTPLVAWLCQLLQARRPSETGAVLTRGYRSGARGHDEPALLSQHCPTLKVVINPDRVAGARQATETLGATWLVMDDGFQHRRLRRNLDLLAVDATCPFGFERLLPAGLLREPITGIRRAQAAILTRSDQVSGTTLDEITHRLKQVNPNLVIARAIHAPQRIVDLNEKTYPLNTLRGRRVFAFCGIGNPEAFYQTLKDLGAQVVGTRSFSDHHLCSSEDLRALHELARSAQADLILTTQKNALGLPKTAQSQSPQISYLEIAIDFTDGRDALIELIDQALASTILPL